MPCCSKTDFRLAVNSPRSSESFETEMRQLSSRYHEAVFPLDMKWQRRSMRRSIFLLSGNWEYLGKKNLPWAHWRREGPRSLIDTKWNVSPFHPKPSKRRAREKNVNW